MKDTDTNPHGLQLQTPFVVSGYRKGQPCDVNCILVSERGHLLEAEAGRAFLRMSRAAELDGVRLHINTAWRSHDEQTALYKIYQRKVEAWEHAPPTGRGPKPPPTAPPGHSNHQWGIAVDIDTGGPTHGPIDAWLDANAKLFGFVRTVPAEGWHWEYRPELFDGVVFV